MAKCLEFLQGGGFGKMGYKVGIVLYPYAKFLAKLFSLR